MHEHLQKQDANQIIRVLGEVVVSCCSALVAQPVEPNPLCAWVLGGLGVLISNRKNGAGSALWASGGGGCGVALGTQRNGDYPPVNKYRLSARARTLLGALKIGSIFKTGRQQYDGLPQRTSADDAEVITMQPAKQLLTHPCSDSFRGPILKNGLTLRGRHPAAEAGLWDLEITEIQNRARREEGERALMTGQRGRT